VLYIAKAHSAFDYERKMITRTADDLVKYLIVVYRALNFAYRAIY
jgi:hypothetical protein